MVRSTVGAVYEGVNKLAVSTMSVVRWLLSAVYCTCFADQMTKSGQWVISSSKQVHYTSDNSQLTADKFRRLPDFFHSSYDRFLFRFGIPRTFKHKTRGH